VTASRGNDGGPSRSSGVSSAARGAILVGLAVILGIVGLQILDDSGPGSGASDATVTTVTGSTVASRGAGTASTTIARRPNGEVKVKVYNASGVQGRAQILTDQLKALGYNMQTPANLSSQRAGTVVECTKGFHAEGVLLALYGVGNGATVEPYPSDPPAGASDADCIVIIGTA
jgi:LytR cell envelope-related transcriptional attenuator